MVGVLQCCKILLGQSPPKTNEMPCKEGWDDILSLIKFQKSLKTDGYEYWRFFDNIENNELYLKIKNTPLGISYFFYKNAFWNILLNNIVCLTYLVSALTKEEKLKDDSLFLFFQWLMAKSTRMHFIVPRNAEESFGLWKAFTQGIQTNFDQQTTFIRFLRNKCESSKTFRLKYVNMKDKNSDFILRVCSSFFFFFNQFYDFTFF